MIIHEATALPFISHVRAIFREYQQSLGIDLCFQDFEQELALLPGKYAPPQGRIYLATVEEEVAGCIALRPFEGSRCEMKRLYVRSAFRGHDLGRKLADTIITDARAIGYKEMLLDTLASMTSAQKLYRSLGFTEIPPYCYNPIEGTSYMRLEL